MKKITHTYIYIYIYFTKSITNPHFVDIVWLSIKQCCACNSHCKVNCLLHWHIHLNTKQNEKEWMLSAPAGASQNNGNKHQLLLVPGTIIISFHMHVGCITPQGHIGSYFWSSDSIAGLSDFFWFQSIPFLSTPL